MIPEKAFTLIEMAIAIVIIGLIVGGILVGKDLIKGAETRNIVSQTQKYETAWNTFVMKYNCLPGDCKDASSLFPAGENGNGDGIVNMWWVWGLVESLQTWNQLSSAGLIDGKYKTPYGNNTIIVGVTNPPTKVNDYIGYAIFSPYSASVAIKLNFSYSLQIGAVGLTNPLWGDVYRGAGFNATQAYDVDQKIDDGQASKGKLTSTNPTEPSVANSNLICLSGSNYKIDTLTTGCIMHYKITQ